MPASCDTTRYWRAALRCVAAGAAAMTLHAATISPAGAQATSTSPFTTTLTPDGFVFGITGIDAADVVAAALPGGTSASLGLTQSLIGNRVTENGVNSSVGFEFSGLDNRGMVNVNQEAGNLNNQANVRVIALVLDGQQIQTFDFDILQVRADNVLTVIGGIRETHISDSFTGTRGVVGINQSAGSLNQESNALLVALGATLGSNVSMVGDSTMASVSSNNSLTEGGGTRTDSMTNSFGNFTGIAQVAQSAGDMNNISNRLVISVSSEMIR